jgi:hypothetical protein
MSDGMLFLPGAFPLDLKVVRPIVQTWAVKRDDKGKKKRGWVEGSNINIKYLQQPLTPNAATKFPQTYFTYKKKADLHS